MDPLATLQELVSLPGPPGQEFAVADYLRTKVAGLGLTSTTDPKGNLIVCLGDPDRATTAVTAHMDEIALLVREVRSDGQLVVGPMGGIHPWKLGEGPVLVLPYPGSVDPIPGVLSFGSIHTESPDSPTTAARREAFPWPKARVFTGLSPEESKAAGIRPGTRVVVHPDRRALLPFGPFVGGYFLDDRADLVAWLWALRMLAEADVHAWFVATTSEEVGGEGARYFAQRTQLESMIALELGADVPDAPIEINDQPTVWVQDGFAAAQPSDLALLATLGEELGMRLQWQALSRGGSDATISGNRGLVARHFTLGLPMKNTHGFEVIHQESMVQLARLTKALVLRIAS